MFRMFVAALLTVLPASVNAQSLSLYSIFEEACLAPSDLFFGETESVLRSWAFEIYRGHEYIEFAHSATGITGAYSPYAENQWCIIHDPYGDTEAADRAAQVLLGRFTGQTLTRLQIPNAYSAYGVPHGGCCWQAVRVTDRSLTDQIGGASMALLYLDR